MVLNLQQLVWQERSNVCVDHLSAVAPLANELLLTLLQVCLAGVLQSSS